MNVDDYLIPHLRDLAHQAEHQYRSISSAFLTLDEQEEAGRVFEKKSNFSLFGGYEEAERKLISFAPLGEEIEHDILCAHLEAKGKKFCGNLTHRDYLGALLGLGIERNTIGDILLGEGEAYVYIVPSIELEVLSLTSVRTTSFSATIVPLSECPFRPKMEEKRITMASSRLDALLSEVFHLSREQAKQAILTGLVHVGSKTLTRPDYLPKENDRIAMKGKGKFSFLGEDGVSKKGKIICRISLYQ